MLEIPTPDPSDRLGTSFKHSTLETRDTRPSPYFKISGEQMNMRDTSLARFHVIFKNSCLQVHTNEKMNQLRRLRDNHHLQKAINLRNDNRLPRYLIRFLSRQDIETTHVSQSFSAIKQQRVEQVVAASTIQTSRQLNLT